eukprot:gene17499-19249_t
MSSEVYFQNKKSEVNELRAKLKNGELQRDRKKYLQVIQKVIAFMTLGIDVSSLYPEMIMASATNDLVQKKLVYHYICTHAESNAELAVLMVNHLQKDSTDDNPMIRGLALRSLFNLRLHNLMDYVKEPLINGLFDRSAYVRRIAVIGSLKLFHFKPSIIKELKIVDQLHDMINDHDNQVFVNSVLVLDEILSVDGGFLIDSNLMSTFIHRLHSLNEWAQCMLMEVMSRYQPQSEEEIFSLMNQLDDRLKHSNKGVMMAAAKLFLLYTKNIEALRNDVYLRLKGPLLSVISSTSSELTFTALCHISCMFKTRCHLLANDYKAFFLRGNEPFYLKNLKLQTLASIVTESNMDGIISEIRQYATDVDMVIGGHAVTCIGKIGTNYSFTSECCLETLILLLKLELDHITPQIFEAIRDLLSKHRQYSSFVISNINDYLNIAADHPSAKAAVIWILGEFGEEISSSPYLLESITNNLSEDDSAEIKLQLLNAGLKLFFKTPSECQNLLGRIFETLIDDELNMDVHDRAMFYYRCLKVDVNKTCELVNQNHRIISESTATADSTIAQNKTSFLEDFNTISMLHLSTSAASQT